MHFLKSSADPKLWEAMQYQAAIFSGLHHAGRGSGRHGQQRALFHAPHDFLWWSCRAWHPTLSGGEKQNEAQKRGARQAAKRPSDGRWVFVCKKLGHPATVGMNEGNEQGPQRWARNKKAREKERTGGGRDAVQRRGLPNDFHPRSACPPCRCRCRWSPVHEQVMGSQAERTCCRGLHPMFFSSVM